MDLALGCKNVGVDNDLVSGVFEGCEIGDKLRHVQVLVASGILLRFVQILAVFAAGPACVTV